MAPRHYLLAFAVPFALTASAAGQSADLKYEYTPGTKLRYQQLVEMNLEQKVGVQRGQMIKVSMKAVFTQKVLRVDDEGVATIQLGYESLGMTATNNGIPTLTFDSTNEQDMESAKLDPKLKSIAAMVGATVNMRVGPLGKVLEVKAPPNLTGSPLPMTVDEMQSSYLQLPGRAVSVGETWNTQRKANKNGLEMSFKEANTLQSLEGARATIPFVMKAKIDTSGNPQLAGSTVTIPQSDGGGTYVFDVAKGYLVSLEHRFTMVMIMVRKIDDRVMKLNQTISTVSKFRLLPPKTTSRPSTGGF